MENIAVLTGDLIDSTSARPEDVERAMKALGQSAEALSGWTGIDTRFTRFRGDGWQLYIENPKFVLRATLFLIACLRAADTGLATRLSIATGPYETLGATGLSGASGWAFIRSGRNLDTMRHYMPLIFASPPGPEHWWQKAVIELAAWQARLWSREQAEAATFALEPNPPTQEQIAQNLGITRQAVQSRVKGAGLAALGSALFAFETQEQP